MADNIYVRDTNGPYIAQFTLTAPAGSQYTQEVDRTYWLAHSIQLPDGVTGAQIQYTNDPMAPAATSTVTNKDANWISVDAEQFNVLNTPVCKLRIKRTDTATQQYFYGVSVGYAQR